MLDEFYTLANNVSELEERVAAIEKRFSEIYERERITNTYYDEYGFKTPQGTCFFVNSIKEWNTVFLEYDNGEDGDMIPMEGFDEAQMFNALNQEILTSELDKRRAKENAYRIYKTEKIEDGLLVQFRFGGNELDDLFAHKTVVIDDKKYKYKRYGNDNQAVIIEEYSITDLYDHWIQFV